MSSFLGILADQINSQFSIGENSDTSLDAVIDGKQVKYGKLGDFASKFDQSAQRRYVEEGYLRVNPYNTDPKQLEVLMQQPVGTILVKKRMFNSIAENFRPDFMDRDEKLYYKAMRILFDNKCRQIASLEQLSKIQQISSAVGNIDEQLVPIIVSLTDSINNGMSEDSNFFGTLGSSDPFAQTKDVSNFTKVVDRLRKIYAFNTSNPNTTWIKDNMNMFQSTLGQGTGVIEITNFTGIDTNVTNDIKSPGTFSFNISDPYSAMLITEYDIERALSDATNSFYNHKSFQFGKESIEQVISDNQNRLNQLRSARNASPISFKVNPDTLLGQRVTAILDRIGIELKFNYDSSGGTGFPGLGGAGNSVTVSPEYLRGGEIAGYDGLDSNKAPAGNDNNIRFLALNSELSVFNSLISAIFQKISLEANSRNAFQTSNKDTNYARRKLRFTFSGQLIIQPMDSVHIYLGTKSRYDTKLLSGLNNMFTGNGILQNLNKTTVDFKNAVDILFNPSNINIQAEKNAYVGAEFPTYLWSMIRGQFITEKEGTHVFAGLVERANDSWNDGKYSVSVSGKDNSAYFEMGKVNFKPGVDSFNGMIYDPLTPFETNFDAITSNAKDNTPKLLEENQYLLGDAQRVGLVKFKLGPAAGQPVTTDNYIQDRSIDPISGLITRVFYAPDGLVYKWKEGIGSFIQFGSSLDINAFNKVGTPNIYKDPFAGQDVMNVISLLITGQPYNFATYWKTTINLNGFGNDPHSMQNAMHSFTASLSKDLATNNALWGNFVPFKSLVVDEQSFSKVLNSQIRVISKNTELDSQISKLKDLNKKAQLFGATNIFSQFDSTRFSPDFLRLQSEQTLLTNQINMNISKLQKEDNSFLTTVGNDTSFDYNQFIDNSKGTNSTATEADRRLIRRQINYLTRRMSYNVRANEDKNLFIVDDYYDKDFDIAAYNKSLADGLALYNNDFNSVKEKIYMTADLLNLEVFCDTQGHVRVRPPQYNRMPSSVFYRMMYLKQSLNVQIFPQFLNDLFTTQISSLREKIETLEDQIRLNCAVLGNLDDFSAQQFIISTNKVTAASGDSFGFISNEDTGLITDIPGILQSANPDQRDSATSQSKDLFSSLENQSTSNKNIFTNSDRYIVIKQSLESQAQQTSGSSILDSFQFNTNPVIDTLINRIYQKTGQKIQKDYFLNSSADNDGAVTLPSGSDVDVFKVTNDLSNQIKDRQRALKLFYGAIKNSVEFKSLDDDNDNTGNQLLTPGLFGNKNVPEVFEHMIEDESYDDYGPGSGSRYIIKRAQIKSLQIYQAAPDFTMVEVHGTLNNYAPEALPQGLNSFPQGGNALTSAVAIDYDLWRQFGLRTQSPINVPFLTDPATQCAPYASMILSRARKNILRGNLVISGNEYMQPGEVVYLEDRAMLFYVTSVKHNITVGASFTTTLDLAYGHTPGEYIPTTLDLIGKMIFNNREIGGYAVQRQSNSGNESNMGSILRSNVSQMVFNTGAENEKANTYSNFNSQTINNILYIGAARLNQNNIGDTNVTSKVELRIYYDNNNPINSDLNEFAGSVYDILISPDSGPKQSYATNKSVSNPAFDSKFVKIVPINLDDINERRSPSQKALDASRDIVKNQHITSTGSQTDVIRKALFSYVVDCWIKFDNIAGQ